MNGSEEEITYHDSCYLARHNDVLESPRSLVEAVGQPVEMERSGKRTFCCGAGGAHMWMEERAGLINEERAREAASTGADTLAVACPFCTVMLDDGVKANGSEMRVADVSTLLRRVARGGLGRPALEGGALYGFSSTRKVTNPPHRGAQASRRARVACRQRSVRATSLNV